MARSPSIDFADLLAAQLTTLLKAQCQLNNSRHATTGFIRLQSDLNTLISRYIEKRGANH
jgi:hypothetical protein